MDTVLLKFVNNKKQVNSKGLQPIYLVVTIAGIDKRKNISTGIYTKPKDFDPNKEIVLRKDPNSETYNNQLSELKSKYREFIDVNNRKNNGFNLEKLKEIDSKKPLSDSFNDYMNNKIDLRLKNNEITESSVKSHKNTYNKLTEYNPNISFDEIIKIATLENLTNFLFNKKDNQHNTVKGFHRNLKIYIRKAINDKIISKDQNPYDIYKIGWKKSNKFFSLSIDDLKKLEDYKPKTLSLQKIKDTFLFSCYTGLAFADYTSLSYEDIIVDNNEYFIKANRQKTNSNIALPLNKLFPQPLLQSKPEQILEKYYYEYLPLKSLPKKERRFFAISNQKMNEYLKDLCKLAKIKKHTEVSTHCGRNTFGTLMCNDFNVQITIVKELMSHSDISQTMEYVNFDLKTMNAILEKTDWNK